MAKTQIKKYVFKPGIGATENLYPDAYSLLSANKSFIQKESTAWIADQVTAGAAGFVGYTYNSEKCERDVGYNIDAYLKDLRYGGNESTRNTIKYYWDQDVAQIDGDRQPEIQTYGFIKSLINSYILSNVLYSASNTEVTQTIDSGKTAEAQAITNLDTLLDNTIDVITNGLSSMPTLVPTGVGTIKIQGRHDLEEILLITNTTSNEIIYNFSQPEKGGLISLKTDGISTDSDFVTYLQTTDAITTITLNYNTSTHSASDDLQIFVEKIENGKSVVSVRPYDFGTDAIERMRVAPALSMLDADFEYGLQPTKWAAIGTLRGYPSIYEVPGTDTAVTSVVTDASAGTNGIGQSLITVTTVGPHGFSTGTPITIKALEDSVSGAARAEGSFVIVTVPTNNTFTYYAKSKVGTVSGTVLSTTYTQLREAGFYTGASIGQPTIDVISNGSSGTLTSELDIASGSTIIPFDGPSPEIGAPLENLNIPEGAQVTTILDTSAGGGEYLTPELVQNVNIGDTSFEVANSAGIVPNLAIDRGDGTATYVSSIVGNTINVSDDFTAGKVANTLTYTNLSPNVNVPIGSNAIFNLSTSAGVYVLDGISNSGENYQVGDRILVAGNNLGGVSPDNDLIIRVETVDSADGIATVTLIGTAVAGDETYTGIGGVSQGGGGINGDFIVSYVNNVYTADVFSPDISGGYTVGDVIVIPGNTVGSAAGTSPTNDLYVSIDSVGAGGAIVSVTASGTAPDAQNSFTSPPYTTSGSGTGSDWIVSTNGATYNTPSEIGASQNYVPGDTITILGTDLGGTSPGNDLTITVDGVDGSGAISAYSHSGTAYNGNSVSPVGGTNRIGSGATFDVTLNAGAYNVVQNAAGTGYNVNQTILISSANGLPGSTPDNDLTVTITGVDDITTGVITSFTVSGTAFDGNATFGGIIGVTQGVTGTNFTLDIERSLGTYQTITVNNGGSGYFVGNSFTVPGPLVDGTGGIHDIDIIVNAVNPGDGAITGITTTFESASEGTQARLISTLVITEATTGNITAGSSIIYGALATLEITTANAHGLVPGNTFIVTVASDDGVNNHTLASGSFFATDVPAVNKLRYQARADGTIDVSLQDIIGTMYPRPDSFFIHRPYDGGVQLGTGGPQHGAQAIRQSKKYIRYQSGKGIMYTTGALFAPSYDLRSVTAEGTEVGDLITIVTDDNDHGVQVGGVIRILGVETPGYNSGPETAVPPTFDYTVESVVDERTFKVRAQRRLGATNAILGFGSQMSVVAWHGATVRSGIFDDQNGIFWEFDGTQISVVQRTGTRQLAGTVSLDVDTNLITGTNTRFRDQLKAGDRIIIKGMTHVVSHVNSQTECTIAPDWRGVVNITGAKINLIVDKKVKQRDFNLDTLDGTGPSGYEIDVAKMQMIGIQYSWYGAGFIDFMLRGQDGNFIFAHRMRNSNVNTEAFMRSGNLPVRYEVTNEGPPGKLAAAMDDSQTTMTLIDTSFFPTNGYVYVDNEIISFTGKDDSTNQLTGLERSATFQNFQAGATRSYTAGDAATHDDRTGVILISQTITPLISHWGSAFITDGGFDEDRGYIFSYSETGLEVSTTPSTAFMIRLSPSVSNALVGDLGERELLNRAQLLLQSLEITSDGYDGSGNPINGGIVVEGILNPKNYPLDVNNVAWTTLSSQAQGGQPSFAQIASSGGIIWSEDATSTVVTPQTASYPTGAVDLAARPWNGRYIENNNRYVLFREDDLDTYRDDNGLETGDYISHPNLPADTRIRNFSSTFNNGGVTYRWVELDKNGQGNNTNSGAANVEKRYSLTNTSRIWFDATSWQSSNIVAGTQTTDTNFTSANTIVNTVKQESFFGTTYYEVNFTSTYTATVNPGTTTVEFTFIQPVYAQPGETVFSFIAQPGERATVDFSELKELTNTPLGGRGTYPNGPDVLAVNVYKVSGTASNANVILNWGEAQA